MERIVDITAHTSDEARGLYAPRRPGYSENCGTPGSPLRRA